MSGSVTPEFGTFVKVLIVLAVFLGMEYVAVIVKLFLYDNRSLTWRIVLGAITPGLILISLIISNATENKAINMISLALLAIVNLAYLLLPVNTHLSKLVYQGSNKIIIAMLLGVFSVSTSLVILIGLVALTYGVLRMLKM